MDARPEKTRLILASSSPRRRQLLAEKGFTFEVIPPPIAEPDEPIKHLSPVQQAEAMAYFKASTVARTHPDACVLGADTVVALGSVVLGKPRDAAHARSMLQKLSGTRHRVITGVALLKDSLQRLIASDVTYVTMQKLTPDEIESYVGSREWKDKAGAYAIQETADQFITKIEGSFSNVVGLPMELVQRMIKELREHGSAHKIV